MLHSTVNPSVIPESCFGAGDGAQPLPCFFPAPGALNGAGPLLQWADAEGPLPRADPRDQAAMLGCSLCPASVAVPVASSPVLLGE